MDGGMGGGMDGGVDGRMDGGWTVSIILERDGHGRWTGWSRKVVKNERFTVQCFYFDLEA